MLAVGEHRAFSSIAGIRLSSRSCSNLAKPATLSGANWLPVALSSASAAVGDHDDHRHRGFVGDQVVEEGVRRREADPFRLVAANTVQQVENRVLPVTRVPGRQIDVRLAPRAGDARVVLERFEAAGRDAGAPRVEARGSVGERPDIVGAQDDGVCPWCRGPARAEVPGACPGPSLRQPRRGTGSCC